MERISIESIYFNQEIINSIISFNLKLESFEISINNHFDLIISGDYDNLILYLKKFGYMEESYQNSDHEIEDLELYFIN